MNEQGRAVLRQAALDGVPQIRNSYGNENGYCALGVLARSLGFEVSGLAVGVCWDDVHAHFSLHEGQSTCAVCGESESGEGNLIVHYNDDHGLDFLAIANKV